MSGLRKTLTYFQQDELCIRRIRQVDCQVIKTLRAI